MGVLKRTRRSAIDASIGENETVAEIVISVLQENDGFDSEGGSVSSVNAQARFCRQRAHRSRLPAIPSDTAVRRNKAQGARRCRRYENTLLLVREDGNDETEQLEVSIEDLAPVKQPARTFGRFLHESSMLGLRNKFLEYTDDSSEQETRSRLNCKREANSADPQQAFGCICRKLRNMLKQRHLPLGIVDALEVSVLDFFLAHPLDSTYECGPMDAYRRGLLHAISQYHNLKSFSIGKHKTQKMVHVQNIQTAFIPPSLRLVSYIENRLQNPDHV